MAEPREDLLQPTLSSDREGAAIYSVQSAFLLAFFAGPIAVTFYSALNSWRLDRMTRDAPIYGGAILFVIALVYFRTRFPETFGYSDPNVATLSGSFRIVIRVVALLMCGGYYLLHRKHHLAMNVTGMDHPSPWVPAISCAAAAFVVTRIIIAGIRAWVGLA